MTLTYFKAKSTLVAHAFEWGKLSKCHLKGKILCKWANELKVYEADKKKESDPGAGLPPPRGNIHVYYHTIQRYSSLKPLGQSKPNFMWSILRKGD